MTLIKIKRGSSVSWAAKNPILSAGEPGLEVDTGQLKVGNGTTPWNSLPYTGSGAIALDTHIDAAEPHPAYDTGPSFTLLYANAKV